MGNDQATILEQIRADATAAMKAGDRRRAGALRMIADAVNQDARFGKDDDVSALRRERKQRHEAAEAYDEAGRHDSAAEERYEAELIDEYLPAEMTDEELAELVRTAIAETGASEPRQMGQVIGAAMERAGGRADGKRVSEAVRERLGS